MPNKTFVQPDNAIHIEHDEAKPLLEETAKNPGFEVHLNPWETVMSFFPRIPRPFSYLCESGTQRDFNDKIKARAVLNGKPIVVDDPAICFRADTREPEELFQKGMNVYSLQRSIKSICCDYSPVCSCAWTCFLPCAIFSCMTTYLPDMASENGMAPFSPGDCCGQNSYQSVYVSGWGALAFSDRYYGASTYKSSNEHWKYIVYFPEGYVDFNAYCNYLISEGIKAHPYASFNDGDGHFSYAGPKDVGEVIPKGIQAVAKTQIIAAVKSDSKEIKINRNFLFYSDKFEREFSQALKDQPNFDKDILPIVKKHEHLSKLPKPVTMKY